MHTVVPERIETIDPQQDRTAWHVLFTEDASLVVLVKTVQDYDAKYAAANAVSVRFLLAPQNIDPETLALTILTDKRWWYGTPGEALPVGELKVRLTQSLSLAVTDVAGSREKTLIRTGAASCFFGFEPFGKMHREDFPIPKVTAIFRGPALHA